MRMIGLLCAGIAAAALTGCGTMQPRTFAIPADAYKCTYNADCFVTVSVTNTNPCRVSVDRPAIEMKGSSRVPPISHQIRWELDEAAVDAKFRFEPRTGVVLKQPDPDDQFSGQGPHGGGTQFHWFDKNTNYAEYRYTINIVQKNSSNTCMLDPSIFNN
jgi:hypothetical protein